MKLLFDKNLSWRIVKKLIAVFPGSNHVTYYNLQEKNDREVWDFAKANNYTIVTNDADFNDFSLVWGFPPKIVWLRTGNTSTKHIIKLLYKEKNNIIDFVNNKNNGILIYE